MNLGEKRAVYLLSAFAEQAWQSEWKPNKHSFYAHRLHECFLKVGPDTVFEAMTEFCFTKKKNQDTPNILSKLDYVATTSSWKRQRMSWETDSVFCAF